MDETIPISVKQYSGKKLQLKLLGGDSFLRILINFVLRNLRSSIDFKGFTGIQTVIFKGFFSFTKFTFIT